MTPTEKHTGWFNSLLIKMGGNRYGRKQFRLALAYGFWCIVWALCVTISDYTLENGMIAEAWIWPMVMLPIMIAPIVFYYYFRFYKGIDELARKVQSNALAAGFGVGIFFLISSMSLNNVGFEELGANEMFAVFVVAYAISSAVMAWRYGR